MTKGLTIAAERFGVVLSNADDGIELVFQFGAALWQAYVFARGLVVGRGPDWTDAAMAGGGVAIVGVLLMLV